MNDVNPGITLSGASKVEALLGTPQPSRWRKRAVLGGAIVTLLALLLLLSRCFAGEADAAYATAEIRRGSLTVTISATGNLQPTNEVEVGSEQSGLITNVYVDNNDTVTKGQPLARLDTARLNDTILQNRAALASAEAQATQALATAAQARSNLARIDEVHRLSGGKVPSQTERDAARAEAARADAAVKVAEAQIAQTRAALSSAQTNLSKATIYSPVKGVVLSRQIDPGQTVAASFSAPILFRIAEDLAQMRLEVKVDEADVGQVEANQRATFTVDAYPGRTFPARIVRVDVGANASDTAAATSASSVVAYTAMLLVDNADLKLRPGMTATADIIVAEARDRLLIPNAALRYSPTATASTEPRGGVTSVLGPQRFRRGGNSERTVEIGRGSRQTIYIVGADGEPQPIEVMTGESNGSWTVVSGAGVKPGMQVITAALATK